MRKIRLSGLMSGDGKRDDDHSPAPASILDSTQTRDLCARDVIKGVDGQEVGGLRGASGTILRRDTMEGGFGHGCAGTALGRRVRRHGIGLAAVDGEGDGAERILEGPAAGQVEADAASGLAQSSADFEQLGRRVSICAERQGWGN